MDQRRFSWPFEGSPGLAVAMCLSSDNYCQH
jgi:hypothetical protein